MIKMVGTMIMNQSGYCGLHQSLLAFTKFKNSKYQNEINFESTLNDQIKQFILLPNLTYFLAIQMLLHLINVFYFIGIFLQSTICRTSSLESGIRNITKEALKEAQQSGNVCGCNRPVDKGCRKCQMTEVCRRLQNAGYNSAICKSKWRSSPDIPSGILVLLSYGNIYIFIWSTWIIIITR